MDTKVDSIDFRSHSPTWLMLGFLFWVAFLLVLEPGNVARAIAAGYQLSFGREVVRIIGAAIIGAFSMPVVLLLVHRYPIAGTRRLQNVLWLSLALIALAGVLNVVSSLVAAWVFEHKWFPDMVDVRRQLVGNWTLLIFALVCLASFVKALPFTRSKSVPNTRRIVRDELRQVLVKMGRRTSRVEIDGIDWIEAQGNYVALHVGARTHLIRETLTRFEEQLDRNRFVRVHRKIIVAVDRIQSIRSTENGGTLRLTTGKELAASRRYRKTVREKWMAANGAGTALLPDCL